MLENKKHDHGIIYVHPDGVAVTEKQVEIYKNTMTEAWADLSEKLHNVLNELAKSLKPVFETMFRIVDEIVDNVDKCDKEKKKGAKEHWRRISHKHGAECRSKIKSRSQIAITNMNKWRSFKRSQHQRKI